MFLTIIWSLLVLFTIICLLILFHVGPSTALAFVKQNAEAIKILLALIAAVYAAGVFHIEVRDNRIANALAFQDRANEPHLRSAFKTINMFWMREEGHKILRKYRDKKTAAKNNEQISAANNLWANQAKIAALIHKHEDEIFLIFEYYRDIVVCVKQGRCHKPTACDLYSNDINNFRITYSEFLFYWEQLWQNTIEGALKHFRSGCVRKKNKDLDFLNYAMP